MCLDELADCSHLPNAFRADKYQCSFLAFLCIHVMSWYSRASVMFSVFALQSRGCGFETRLVHMPVMLVTNVHPGVIIKPNRQ